MRTLTRSNRLAIKNIAEGGLFEGYASVFGVEDLGQDIVVKGAFRASLAERGTRGIKMLYEHNEREPIGVWQEIHEDDTGLYAKGRLLIDAVDKAREVYALLKEGVLDALSIGYRTVTAKQDASRHVRLLEELDLREISVVIFPMNEDARIVGVKGGVPTEREFERWLTQDAGFSRSQARLIISGGFKRLLSAKPGAGDEGGALQHGEAWGDAAQTLDRLLETLRN